MKIVRLVLATLALSTAAACASEVTAPSVPTQPRVSADGASSSTSDSTTDRWGGLLGSGN